MDVYHLRTHSRTYPFVHPLSPDTHSFRSIASFLFLISHPFSVFFSTGHFNVQQRPRKKRNTECKSCPPNHNHAHGHASSSTSSFPSADMSSAGGNDQDQVGGTDVSSSSHDIASFAANTSKYSILPRPSLLVTLLTNHSLTLRITPLLTRLCTKSELHQCVRRSYDIRGNRNGKCASVG